MLEIRGFAWKARIMRVPLRGDRAQSMRADLVDTAVRGLLGVALLVAFPPFSDLYRLWRRDAGISGPLAPGEFEYPPVALLFWEPLSRIPSSRAAVAVNALIMVLLAVLLTYVIVRWPGANDRPRVGAWSRSLSVIFFLGINWDIAATLLLIFGLYRLEQERPEVSGASIGFGTALKVFPGSVLAPVAVLIAGTRRRVRFLAFAVLAVAVPYLLYRVSDQEGWRFHLDFAAERDDYETTLWWPLVTGLEKAGISFSLSSVNLAAAAVTIIALAAATVWAWRRRPTFAEAAVVAVAAFILANKTFKPQYTLWLVPLFAVTGVRLRTTRVFEGAALVEFAAIFLSLSWLISGAAAIVRTLAMLGGVIEVVRRRRANVLD